MKRRRPRRLAGVLYAMWRDGVRYDAQQLRPRADTGQQRAGYEGDAILFQ